MTRISPTSAKPHIHSVQDLESGMVSEGASLAHESERLLAMGDPPKERERGRPLKIDIPSSKDMGSIFEVPVPVPNWLVAPGDANGITGFSYADEPDAPPGPPLEVVKSRSRVPEFFTFEPEHTGYLPPVQMDANVRYEPGDPAHRPPVRHEGSGGKLDCSAQVIVRAGAALALGGAAALVVGGLQQAGVLEGGDDAGQSAALFGGGGMALTAGLRCVYHFYKRRQTTG